MVGENFGTTTARVCDVSRATADKAPQQSRLNFCSKQKQSPGAPLTNFNDGGRGGGPTEVHILYPKKSQLQNLSTQKNHNFF